MPNFIHTSIDDPRLSPYRDLPKANLTALSRRFIVEGKLLVDRLVSSDFSTESLVVDERRLSLVPENCPAEVPVYVVPAGEVDTLIGFNFHRGILGCGLRKPPPPLSELLVSLPERATFLACVSVQDPTNLGGILRNAAAFGVDGVFLSPSCADPFSRRVLRVSMGTVFKLKIFPSSDLLTDLTNLQEQHGVELVATVLDDKVERLEVAQRANRMTLLIGNEAHGLSDEWIARCRRQVTLPMEFGTDSLNAAAASAVFLYHFTRVALGALPATAKSEG